LELYLFTKGGRRFGGEAVEGIQYRLVRQVVLEDVGGERQIVA